MTRLLAYLTDDVVRILPRWVAWLEAGLTGGVMGYWIWWLL